MGALIMLILFLVIAVAAGIYYIVGNYKKAHSMERAQSSAHIIDYPPIASQKEVMVENTNSPSEITPNYLDESSYSSSEVIACVAYSQTLTDSNLKPKSK